MCGGASLKEPVLICVMRQHEVLQPEQLWQYYFSDSIIMILLGQYSITINPLQSCKISHLLVYSKMQSTQGYVYDWLITAIVMQFHAGLF